MFVVRQSILDKILKVYAKDDIWNMDETGVFQQGLPDCGFGSKGRQCKQRVTFAFFVSATGKKKKDFHMEVRKSTLFALF